MDAGKIERLFSVLGSERTKHTAAWVNGTCPFAQWRHSKGRDRRPSFGIAINAGGESHVFCHSCGVTGSARDMIWLLARFRSSGVWKEGDDGKRYWKPLPWYARACRLVSGDCPSTAEFEYKSKFAEDPSPVKISRTAYWLGSPSSLEMPKPPPIDSLEYGLLPEKDLKPFAEIPPAVRDYLMGPRRRLTTTTIEVFELGWQPHRRRVVIPVRDHEGGLVAITGRALDKKVKDPETGEIKWIPEQEPKFLHSKGFKRDYFLFGEHLADKTDEGILVEGHFDVLYLHQMGYPSTCGIMGSHMSAVQASKIVQFFKRVIILPDGDEAGAKAAEAWSHTLKGRIPVAVADVTPGKDPDNYEQDELDEMLAFDNLNFS
jgi:5S rRNA maturation endonuclease (ribonuclease M5)